MAGSLEGRKVLITGASSGIGEATAEAMVAEGAAVREAEGLTADAAGAPATPGP